MNMCKTRTGNERLITPRHNSFTCWFTPGWFRWQ